jgi:hypothetical protein
MADNKAMRTLILILAVATSSCATTMTPEQAAAMQRAGDSLMRTYGPQQGSGTNRNCTYMPNGLGGWVQHCDD